MSETRFTACQCGHDSVEHLPTEPFPCGHKLQTALVCPCSAFTLPSKDGDLTPVQEGAVELHELFVSMLAAGFTDGQACRILGSMLGTRS